MIDSRTIAGELIGSSRVHVLPAADRRGRMGSRS